MKINKKNWEKIYKKIGKNYLLYILISYTFTEKSHLRFISIALASQKILFFTV